MNSTIKDLIERRSCKKYVNKVVEDDKLDLILKAGTYAPTGMNKQSPVIVAIRNEELINRIACENAKVMGLDIDPFYGAKTLVIVLADKNVRTCVDDGNLVIGNMLNAAHSLGVDSCYIYRAKEVFETDFGKQLLKQWNLTTDYIGIGNVILGYRAEGGVKSPSERKENYILKIN